MFLAFFAEVPVEAVMKLYWPKTGRVMERTGVGTNQGKGYRSDSLESRKA
jgi:hypothetical protein